MTMRIIITGGTIDKEYDPKKQKFELKKTHIKNMLREGRFSDSAIIDKLMLKDSIEMTNEDRIKILKECKKSKEKQIVITHGTDSMAETAQLLDKHVNNKTIILTGAMIPETLEKTDALFNLGGAIIAAQTLKTGVYIVINGKIFFSKNVRKNVKKSIFEKIK
ncbi:MAG: asparaginase domain-containing protein [Candidatus Woesearchaeota archaeon]